MWPKEDILFYEIDQPLSKLLYLFIDKQCTRIPVCQGSLEHVIGIITAMQFFQHQKNIIQSEDLLPYLQKPFFVPETTLARLLLKRMDDAGHILALIVDEYGTIIGLISREDLIEVVVGRIEDEKDPHPLYINAGKNEVIASGKWELAEFNTYFHVNLKSPCHAVTIGGWLTEHLGEIPKGGTKVNLEGFHFHVLAANQVRITRLFIRRLH
jgi:CBS domain containing-hemolysin-like protein